MPKPAAASTVSVWRHPRPVGAAGRCIGHTDLPVDRRKAKRLAHRIRHCVRRDGGPHVVLTSPLLRSASVGRWLKRWGWTHEVDERLSEMDFGHWDGRPWDDIGAAAVQAWCADFADHPVGGAESVAALIERCRAFLAQSGERGPRCIVGHAGWISAATWLVAHPAGHGDGHGDGPSASPTAAGPSAGPTAVPDAASWPAAVAYGARVTLDCVAAPARPPSHGQR